MGKKQETVKMNKRLLNAKMEQKFNIAFVAVVVGFILVAAIGLLNMHMLAKSGGFSLFWPFYRLFGFW